VPPQAFGCLLGASFHFLRGGDDLDRRRDIASGTVGVAVAAGEGKAHRARGVSAPRVAGPQYGGEAVTIKRGAGEGGVDQLVAQVSGALVGDRERSELLAMGRQFLGEVGEAEDQGAGGRGVDAGLADPAHDVAGRAFRGHEAAVLERAWTALLLAG